MSTSLAQQLQNLATPQALLLTDAKSRASILFDPKEAATKDRQAIYEIGLSGLLELSAFNPAFKHFQLTLFDEATIQLERSVELNDVNQMLDMNIAKFLRLLSPYFLLRPAHMCFEWLLRRFHIHVYNRSEIMALILPYHETNTFVQVIQLMRLKNSKDQEWGWLHKLQRPGIPLPKSAIINRAASEPSFLAFICQSTQKTIKELGPQANQLQAQINFYATVVVGALQVAKPVKDWHIATILASLLKGLVSDTVDYVAASYVIISQLVTQVQLKTKVTNALLERVANCTFARLHTTALLLLVWILDKQQSGQPEFTDDTMLNLVCQKWLLSSLASLAKENIATQSICMPLMRGAVAALRNSHLSSDKYEIFLENLLSEVPLSSSSAQQLIDCFLDSYVGGETQATSTPASIEGGTIIIDSDDEMEGDFSQFQSWYSSYLEKLERRYPDAFDVCVKKALSSKSKSNNSRIALKLALGFRLNTSDEKAKRAFEKLYHYSADWRLSAVNHLLNNLNVTKKKERSYNLLQQCLPDRINDESAAVVAAVLTLPTDMLCAMLGAEKLAKILCDLLQRSQLQQDQDWQAVVPRVVEHLTNDATIGNYDNNLVLLALMPYLFPSDKLTEHEHAALLTIISSDFCQHVNFLRQLNVCSSHEDFNVGDHRKHFLDVIAKAQKQQQKNKPSLSAATLLESVEANGGVNSIREPLHLTHLLLLLTAYAKRELRPKEALNMLQRVNVFSANFQFRTKSSKRRNDFVPLQLYADFVQTLVRNTKFQESQLTTSQWTEPSEELQFCILLVDSLTAQMYSDRYTDNADRQEWSKTVKQCLNLMLPSAQDKLEFLSNFYLYESLPALYTKQDDFALLRMRAFKLLQAVLRGKLPVNCSLLHVMRLANACASPLKSLRVQALETLQLLSKLEPHVAHYVTCLLDRRSELIMDHEQYALIVFTILESDDATTKQKLLLPKLRREMLALICDTAQPPSCTAALIQLLKHVNDEQLLTALLPLAIDALQHVTKGESGQQLKQLLSPYSDIYRAVIERFEGNVALNVLLRKPNAWQLIEKTFENFDVYMQVEQKLQPLPCQLLATLTPETFEKLQTKQKIALLELIVVSAAKSDNDNIFLAAHKLFKRCIIECQPLVAMLSQMSSSQTEIATARRRTTTANSKQLDLTSMVWKQGMALLELLEHKKHLIGAELLIPPLFDLLQLCLALEEHSAAEYPKQLILSSLLHCCQSAQSSGVQLAKALPESCFRIEQVVQCLRNTQNPQTQQQALLFLTRCAELYPKQVLHKIVEIFTFVGTTIARHDDAFSLHIINNVVLSIIPTLLQQQPGQHHLLVIPVLKVFSDICIDVPVHRRLPLYATLFSVLEPKTHLWQFLCIVFESQVVQQQPTTTTATKTVTSDTRMEFARELTLMFKDPQVILGTCVRLLEYLTQLPNNKPPPGSSSTTLPIDQLFDARTHSFKHLRHYTYLLVDFLSSLSSSVEFQLKVRNNEQDEQMKSLYQEFILKTLGYVSKVNNAMLGATATASLEKYWQVVANHVHDVLDNAIGLLTPEYFLNVITELLQYELIPVRIKVLELLITKLGSTSTYFEVCDVTHFSQIFTPLNGVVDSILEVKTANAQQARLQQTTLQALQLLANRYGRQFISEFRTLLATLTRITKKRSNVPKAVMGNVVLTLVEICANLKAHSLAQLPKFMPQLTELLKEQVQLLQRQATADYLCSALITALKKLFMSLPLFLGPYLVDTLCALLRVSVQLDSSQLSQDKNAQTMKLRLNDLYTEIANGVEMRILIPSCATAYSNLLDANSYEELATLMQLVLQCVRNNKLAQLQLLQLELSELFLSALEFRLHVRNCKDLNSSRVDYIESAVIEAFVAWILKLSESSFRPMYTKVYKWANLVKMESKEKILTFFLLTNKIAEALKSLFVLFAGDVINDAAQLLGELAQIEEGETTDLHLNVQLEMAVLGTLHHLFLHSTGDFINATRFNTLMPPIVDQLESTLVLRDEQLQQSLVACIAQLAVAVSNDVLWKQLNNQVLLKTRTSTPEVRILAFNSCVAIARKLGESFAPLLPETVPFIAELLEDEHESVEKNTRSAVQELETILGEPVQKYL